MFVVFRTLDAAPHKGRPEPVDQYEVHHLKAAAMATLRAWQEDSNTYAAGMGQIAAATEPHWEA